MKRIFLCTLFCLLMLLAACAEEAPAVTQDYSGYPFADVQWIRDTECDETLRFLSDGGFRYSCACGSPVDDADLVESYHYDEGAKTFSLQYYEEFEGMRTTIGLLYCDENRLELDFDGQTRVFYREGVSPEDISG